LSPPYLTAPQKKPRLDRYSNNCCLDIACHGWMQTEAGSTWLCTVSCSCPVACRSCLWIFYKLASVIRFPYIIPIFSIHFTSLLPFKQWKVSL